MNRQSRGRQITSSSALQGTDGHSGVVVTDNGLPGKAVPAGAAGVSRVLVFTYGSPGGFLRHLYTGMKRQNRGLEFDACAVEGGRADTNGESQAVFGGFLPMEHRRWSLAFLGAAACALFSGHLFQRVGLALCCGAGGWRSLLVEASLAIRAVAVQRQVRASGPYDLYHVHYCVPARLLCLQSALARGRVICSFWGTDLLRQQGLHSYAVQAALLERADAITVQTLELGELLLVKFGRHLAAKLHYCRFPVDMGMFAEIDRLETEPDTFRSLKARLGIDPGQVVVGVGNNGNPANQHLEIIRSLGRLAPELRNRLLVVCPMTYGLRPDHASAVEAACEQHGMRCLLLRRFLSPEELAAFRLALDFFLYLPISDALSGTVLESIYAGSTVLAGAWLPYGTYRRLGLPFQEVESFHTLPRILATSLGREGPWRTPNPRTRQAIRESFDTDLLAGEWMSVYDQVLARSSGNPQRRAPKTRACSGTEGRVRDSH